MKKRGIVFTAVVIAVLGLSVGLYRGIMIVIVVPTPTPV